MQAAIDRFRRGDFRRGPDLTLSPVERMHRLLEEIVACPIFSATMPQVPLASQNLAGAALCNDDARSNRTCNSSLQSARARTLMQPTAATYDHANVEIIGCISKGRCLGEEPKAMARFLWKYLFVPNPISRFGRISITIYPA
jgi:hypothetical protein